MTIESYINKVLKSEKRETRIKKNDLIFHQYLNIAFDSVKERVLQLKKDKVLHQGIFALHIPL